MLSNTTDENEKIINEERPSVELFIKIAKDKNYVVYDNRLLPYKLNIVGWRNRNIEVDKFNDKIALYWIDSNGMWQSRHWIATTLPGKFWLQKLINPKGTAIVVPGQYLDAYSIGFFRTYATLRQVGPIKIYRDKNLDSVFDYNPEDIEEGVFGVHIHRANFLATVVGNWSAGCQVFQRESDYEEFIDMCKYSRSFHGNKFTYTLLEI